MASPVFQPKTLPTPLSYTNLYRSQTVLSKELLSFVSQSILMLSKNKIKYIKSLDHKKIRKEEHAFLAEGHKIVEELCRTFPCKLLIATADWLENNPHKKADEVIEVTQEELAKASLLKAPQQVLAVFEQKHTPFTIETLKHSLCLALDDIQDPGNLGTIIRVADWFGIRHILCSHGTADAYNPKTVQATMGALARVQVHYTDLAQLVKQAREISPVYGTFLDGNNLYTERLSDNGLIIMGNEGNGIHSELEALVSHKLLIPNYPVGTTTSESLNVAMATGIICAEFRRRTSFP